MIELSIALVLVICLGVVNGNIAMQLSYMEATNQEEADHYKGLWHSWTAITFLAVFLTLVVFVYYFTLTMLQALVLMGSVQFLLYDNVINITRGLPIWRYHGTCEGDWDWWDCLMLRIDAIIPVNILRLLFFGFALWWRFG